MTLAIGGVGVMNIMLVPVENACAKSLLAAGLGPEKAHIRWQFLRKALVLTLAARRDRHAFSRGAH